VKKSRRRNGKPNKKKGAPNSSQSNCVEGGGNLESCQEKQCGVVVENGGVRGGGRGGWGLDGAQRGRARREGRTAHAPAALAPVPFLVTVFCGICKPGEFCDDNTWTCKPGGCIPATSCSAGKVCGYEPDNCESRRPVCGGAELGAGSAAAARGLVCISFGRPDSPCARQRTAPPSPRALRP
jgi:hypothetical protein